MFLEINDNTPIAKICETFTNFYPYLKIDFFRKAHGKYDSSNALDKVSSNATIGDLKKTHVSAFLEIQPRYKIADVEKEFQQRFGLSVQISMKKNNTWVQTTDMDDFSLKDLNVFSRNNSDDFILYDTDSKAEIDYDTPDS